MLAAVTSAERSHDRILAILCRQAPKFFFDVYLKRVLLTNKGHRRETPPGGLMERSALMSTYFVLLRALERHIVAARAVFADKLIQEKGGTPNPCSHNRNTSASPASSVLHQECGPWALGSS